MTDWLNKTTRYGYDDADRPTSIGYPNGVATSCGYDPAGWLQSVSHAKGGVTLASVTYNTRDNAGNPTSVTETSVPLAGTSTYSYDAQDRLIGATYPDASRASWSYDVVGSRTTGSTTPPGGTPTTVTAAYDAANRLCWTATGTPAVAGQLMSFTGKTGNGALAAAGSAWPYH